MKMKKKIIFPIIIFLSVLCIKNVTSNRKHDPLNLRTRTTPIDHLENNVQAKPVELDYTDLEHFSEINPNIFDQKLDQTPIKTLNQKHRHSKKINKKNNNNKQNKGKQARAKKGNQKGQRNTNSTNKHGT